MGQPHQKLKISPSVMSLVKCQEKEMKLMQSAIKKIIPYLESLSGLRYYPVPTYIVDEYTIKETSLTHKENEEEKDKSLVKDLKEILRFAEAVCITFHTRAFVNSNGMQIPNDFSYYRKYSNLSEEAVKNITGISEAIILYLEEYLQGDLKHEHWKRFYMPEIEQKKEFLPFCRAVLEKISDIMRELSKEEPQIRLKENYFNDGRKYRDSPDLQVWSRRVYKNIDNYVDGGGFWIKELGSVTDVFEFAIKEIFNLIDEISRENHRYSYIIKELQTYGVYLHANDKRNSKLEQILHKNGFSEWVKFSLRNTGKVLISLDKIKKRMQQSGENGILEKLLAATLVHEHTHAITYEGIGRFAGEKYFRKKETSSKIKYKAVSESLAEWSEFNYFRNDEILSDIISQHADYGKLPYWPYAGALVIDRVYDKNSISPAERFKIILDAFRKDSDWAYEMMKELKE